MKIVHKTIILALAAICLLSALAVPALSNPWGKGAAGIHHGGWLMLADDVTEEDLNNMTLAEIKDLKQQKMQELQNMTPAEIQDLRERKWQELENMTLSEIRDVRQNRAQRGQNVVGRGMAGYFGGFGPAAGLEICYGQAGCKMSGFAGPHGGMWMLLVDDATRDNLQNMTLSEIDDLRQQKMQEFESMTLAEIRDLKEQKMQDLQNTTLSELKEQRPRMSGRGGPFMGFGFGYAGGYDFGDMPSWMPGAVHGR
jgi:phosphoribosylformylglycinamidine (FGAM) synthase PurS component